MHLNFLLRSGRELTVRVDDELVPQLIDRVALAIRSGSSLPAVQAFGDPKFALVRLDQVDAIAPVPSGPYPGGTP